ncbi:hypothetical protein CASFOL_005959 [Castilleja foliolosa]|uniref:Protein PAIR1 n=1 Tax=Castilleja foliolosa TaxID=1961234 RepID=A0ABD3E8Z8_9LAMI
MTLKLNKACDLSSISVLPPQSRRSSVVPSGLDSSSIYGRSQTASQIRPQQSQMTLSQGASSQHGPFSQFSQSSQDEILTNEKLGSQERENSVRRPSFLPPTSYTREESQMMVSRASNSLVRKRSGQEYKSQISEDLEHRIGVIETSLSRLGMILDSVQSDIIQVNKGTQEVSLEMQSVRKKLFAQDDTLQTMGKVQEDIKACLKSVSDQLKQIKNKEKSGEIISSLSSALSEKIDTRMVKLQNDLHMDFCKEIQAISCSMKNSKQNQAILSTNGSKAVVLHASSPLEVKFPNNARRNLKEQQKSQQPKVEVGGTSVKHKQERAPSGVGNLRRNQIKASRNQMEQRIVIDSDEETDEGFSCLLKGTVIDDYSVEQAMEETARILRKARRRKRKYSNTIIIN